MKIENLTIQKGLKIEKVQERTLPANIVIVKDEKPVSLIQKLLNFFAKR